MENFKQLNATLENLPSSQAKIHKVFISFMQFEKPRQPHVKGGPMTEIEVIESLPYIKSQYFETSRHRRRQLH